MPNVKIVVIFRNIAKKWRELSQKKQKAAVKQPFADVLGYFQKYIG